MVIVKGDDVDREDIRTSIVRRGKPIFFQFYEMYQNIFLCLCVKIRTTLLISLVALIVVRNIHIFLL